MVSNNISIILQVVLGISSVVMPLIAAWVAKEAIKFFHVSASSATAAHVTQGVDALSDLALAQLHGAAAANISMSSSAAVAKVVSGATDALLAACKNQGTTPEQLGERVAAALIPKIGATPSP